MFCLEETVEYPELFKYATERRGSCASAVLNFAKKIYPRAHIRDSRVTKTGKLWYRIHCRQLIGNELPYDVFDKQYGDGIRLLRIEAVPESQELDIILKIDESSFETLLVPMWARSTILVFLMLFIVLFAIRYI